jgi:hypothetical protein
MPRNDLKNEASLALKERLLTTIAALEERWDNEEQKQRRAVGFEKKRRQVERSNHQINGVRERRPHHPFFDSRCHGTPYEGIVRWTLSELSDVSARLEKRGRRSKR